MPSPMTGTTTSIDWVLLAIAWALATATTEYWVQVDGDGDDARDAMNWYWAALTVVVLVTIGGRPPAPLWWIAFAPLGALFLYAAVGLLRDPRAGWAPLRAAIAADGASVRMWLIAVTAVASVAVLPLTFIVIAVVGRPETLRVSAAIAAAGGLALLHANWLLSGPSRGSRSVPRRSR
jgi:hypothetical protein